MIFFSLGREIPQLFGADRKLYTVRIGGNVFPVNNGIRSTILECDATSDPFNVQNWWRRGGTSLTPGLKLLAPSGAVLPRVCDVLPCSLKCVKVTKTAEPLGSFTQFFFYLES